MLRVLPAVLFLPHLRCQAFTAAAPCKTLGLFHPPPLTFCVSLQYNTTLRLLSLQLLKPILASHPASYIIEALSASSHLEACVV